MEIFVFIKARSLLIPLEEEKVQVIIVLGEEVAQDAVWVATFDLVGRQAKVDALYKVPELSYRVPVEPPVEQKKTHQEKETSMVLKRTRITTVRLYASSN